MPGRRWPRGREAVPGAPVACTRWCPDIAALVVGALDRDEAILIAAHLCSCPGCRAEYDELAQLRGWLRLLPWHDIAPM